MVKQYELPILGGRIRPFSNPSGAVLTLFGAFVSVTLLLYVYLLAQNRGVPLMNRLVGMIPGVGNRLQTGGNNVRVV